MNFPYYMNQDNANIPVIPLPNPGEGGPAAPGPGGGSNIPIIPLPNPGEGGPAAPGPDNGGSDGIPMIPLPNPGEGGPAAPGPGNVIGSIITTFPRPNIPCFYCNTTRTGNVRFLNAANGYTPFLIYISRQLVVNGLGFAEISQYGRVSSGFQTVTITGMNGYIYIQKPMMIAADSMATIAIINTESGLDLTQISDLPCATPNNSSCFRACNLSYNSGPLNILSNNGNIIFRNVQYKEVTSFNRIRPGGYQFSVARSSMTPMPRNNDILVTSYVNIQPNSIYTMYIFNWSNSPDSIRTMVVEDRQS